jgi:DNA-binding transcriptional LysR family regulator
MELRHLRYFVALAEELHFGRAALRLAITQPPLSFAIQSLEKELGIRLFERDNKRVELTPAGAAYYVEAQAILERIKLANDTARSVASGNLGRLDIGFTGSMVYRHVPGIVSDFIERHPGIEVTLREQSSMEQIEGLLHGRLHAGFINTPHVPEGLAGQPLPDDPFVCWRGVPGELRQRDRHLPPGRFRAADALRGPPVADHYRAGGQWTGRVDRAAVIDALGHRRRKIRTDPGCACSLVRLSHLAS